MNRSADEETDDPHYADDHNLYKVEKWSRDCLRVELMRGNNLDKARSIFARTTKYRPCTPISRLRLSEANLLRLHS
jgi:hypothetical protein